MVCGGPPTRAAPLAVSPLRRRSSLARVGYDLADARPTGATRGRTSCFDTCFVLSRSPMAPPLWCVVTEYCTLIHVLHLSRNDSRRASHEYCTKTTRTYGRVEESAVNVNKLSETSLLLGGRDLILKKNRINANNESPSVTNVQKIFSNDGDGDNDN